jgi:hypothetical protein
VALPHQNVPGVGAGAYAASLTTITLLDSTSIAWGGKNPGRHALPCSCKSGERQGASRQLTREAVRSSSAHASSRPLLPGTGEPTSASQEREACSTGDGPEDSFGYVRRTPFRPKNSIAHRRRTRRPWARGRTYSFGRYALLYICRSGQHGESTLFHRRPLAFSSLIVQPGRRLLLANSNHISAEPDT